MSAAVGAWTAHGGDGLQAAGYVQKWTALDGEHAKHSHELWKSIFEDARAVAHPDGQASGRARVEAHEIAAQHEALMHADARGSLRVNQSPRVEAAGTVSLCRSAALSEAVAPSAQSGAVPAVEASAHPPALPPGTARRAACRMQHLPDIPPMPKLAPQAQRAAAESIQVFVQSPGVSILVRDAALSAEEALRCAFAAAEELCGRRAALRHVTLNGRTIYGQHVAAAHATLTLASARLVFVC